MLWPLTGCPFVGARVYALGSSIILGADVCRDGEGGGGGAVGAEIVCDVVLNDG